MEKNMGISDRMVRPSLAAIIMALYSSGKISGLTGKLLLGLSGVFVITSLFGSCPIYKALGINTIPENEISKLN